MPSRRGRRDPIPNAARLDGSPAIGIIAEEHAPAIDIAHKANDTPYGLGASIWSRDLSKVHRLIPKIKAGTVWVNCHNLIDPALPFGGFKQSGIGREMGRNVIDLYTETKSVCMAV